jgi:multiple sugar transport system ATP-binding protein
MANVKLKNIFKIYPSRDKKFKDGVLAVNDFSMDIEDNEFIVFVGPSGCGKSTTLRMIAGLEEISSGELYIDGEYMNDTEPKDRDISMVFQNYALYPHMTAYQNIAFGLKLRKKREPKFIENEEVTAKLLKIKELKVENNKYYKIVSKNENEISNLEKKLSKRQELLEEVEEELSRDIYSKYHTSEIKNKLIKLTSYRNELKDAISSLELKISTLTSENTKLKTLSQENEQTIEQLFSELLKYQEQDIDKAMLRKLNKNLSFYRRLLVKDNKKKSAASKALECCTVKLESILSQMKDDKYKNIENDTKLQEEFFVMEVEHDSILDDINFYRREIEILESRLGTIESRIQETMNKIVYYETTKQPMYIYRHYTKAEIHQKVMRASKVLDIEKLLGRKPREMSGGQRQRIALGRSIVREPKVFLLDEPLSNLDAKLRSVMRSEITKLHKELQTTFIYVTHDQVEAMTMGTRIVVMKDGVIQQIDSPTNLFDYPNNVFVAGFIGTPQMNFFNGKGTVKDNKLVVTFETGDTLEFDLTNMRGLVDDYKSLVDSELIVGIRGENIILSDKGLSAKVTLIEVLGNETHIHLSLENINNEMILISQERTSLRIDDIVKINFDEKHIHLFDKKTTKSIMVR